MQRTTDINWDCPSKPAESSMIPPPPHCILTLFSAAPVSQLFREQARHVPASCLVHLLVSQVSTRLAPPLSSGRSQMSSQEDYNHLLLKISTPLSPHTVFYLFTCYLFTLTRSKLCEQGDFPLFCSLPRTVLGTFRHITNIGWVSKCKYNWITWEFTHSPNIYWMCPVLYSMQST